MPPWKLKLYIVPDEQVTMETEIRTIKKPESAGAMPSQ